jgi:hypothetical protein
MFPVNQLPVRKKAGDNAVTGLELYLTLADRLSYVTSHQCISVKNTLR